VHSHQAILRRFVTLRGVSKRVIKNVIKSVELLIFFLSIELCRFTSLFIVVFVCALAVVMLPLVLLMLALCRISNLWRDTRSKLSVKHSQAMVSAGTPVFIQSQLFVPAAFLAEDKADEICTDSIQRFADAELYQWIDHTMTRKRMSASVHLIVTFCTENAPTFMELEAAVFTLIITVYLHAIDKAKIKLQRPVK
jgi:hypothetical protein